MKISLKHAVWAPIALFLLGSSSCKDNGAPAEQTAAIQALNGLWTTTCSEVPADINVPNSVVGYSQETLRVERYSATQTFDYYQDPECSIAVTPEQVTDAEQPESTFLQQQSVELSLRFPFGMENTDLGRAQYISLEEVSVAVDEVTLTPAELAERNIELRSLVGIFVVTPSDRLHLATSELRRPTTVALDSFYIRKAE